MQCAAELKYLPGVRGYLRGRAALREHSPQPCLSGSDFTSCFSFILIIMLAALSSMLTTAVFAHASRNSGFHCLFLVMTALLTGIHSSTLLCTSNL